MRHVDQTGSTNADLLAEAATAADRTALATGLQTAGRGRLGRMWESPPGANLLVSMLFREVPGDPGELTRRVGLAAVVVARDIAGVDATLKWPNDVLVGDAKLAGILAQRDVSGAVVVGIGVNVGWAPDGAARLGVEHEPAQVLAALLRAYDALPDDIGPLYRASLATLGMRVRVQMFGGDIVGTAVDVDATGRLMVLDECAITHRIDAGDVVHLRPI